MAGESGRSCVRPARIDPSKVARARRRARARRAGPDARGRRRRLSRRAHRLHRAAVGQGAHGRGDRPREVRADRSGDRRCASPACTSASSTSPAVSARRRRRAEWATTLKELRDSLETGDVFAAQRAIDRHFPGAHLSLGALLPGSRERVLAAVLGDAIREAEKQIVETYDENAPLIRWLVAHELPVPEVLHTVAEASLRRRVLANSRGRRTRASTRCASTSPKPPK